MLKKLVRNFFDQKKSMLHYENLDLYLRLELKLRKANRVLEFNQSQWLKLYIELNTRKRTEVEKTKDKMEKRSTN